MRSTGSGGAALAKHDTRVHQDPEQSDGDLAVEESSDEEPLVPGTRESQVCTRSTVPASSAALQQAGVEAGFSRGNGQVRGHVDSSVAPTQWESDADFPVGTRPPEFNSQLDNDESQGSTSDALQRDLEGPLVFPMSDGAEVVLAQIDGRPRRQSRILVLIPQLAGTPRSVHERSGSEGPGVQDLEIGAASDDTESLYIEGSAVSGEEMPIPPTEPDPVVVVGGANPAIRAVLMWLDEVDLEAEFSRRAAVLKTVPQFLRGPYRSAMRLAMEEAHQGNEQRRERGWKVFLLLPRLLLYRPPRGGNVHKGKLAQRFDDFFQGRWRDLLAASRQCAEKASVAQRRKRRRQRPDEELQRRAGRALSLVQMGELSSGRHALEGASLALGTRQTSAALRDPNRRPPVPSDPLAQVITDHQPMESFALDAQRFASNLRSSRRRAAAGVSGMTTNHLRPVLDDIRDTHSLFQIQQLATARIRPNIHGILRLGKLTALQKPHGGVRGIVVGDVVRRLVGRTMAQQLSKNVKAATAPHPTRAGTACVAHALQVLTEMDAQARCLTKLTVSSEEFDSHFVKVFV